MQDTQHIGIFPDRSIADMVSNGQIDSKSEAGIEADQIQPASLDLRLGDYAYPVDTSFLPGEKFSVLDKMRRLDGEFERFKIDLRQGSALEKGRVYVVLLQEAIHLEQTVEARANPKSSTGRLDILVRLIVDQGMAFDQVPQGYSGPLYAEVVPRSFSVVVRTGDRLNQLRFRRLGLSHEVTAKEWQALLTERQLGCDEQSQSLPYEETGRLRFTIDLKNSHDDSGIVGWRARKHSQRIDLARRDYSPLDYWEPIYTDRNHVLILDPDEFYILATRESVAIPPDFAAEMVPYDTRAGEFRVHYAGFFDPGFGWDAKTRSADGSRGVLEVRSREVPFLLEHGQTVGWLIYERMAEIPDALYGYTGQSNYQHQRLKLAKQFSGPEQTGEAEQTEQTEKSEQAEKAA